MDLSIEFEKIRKDREGVVNSSVYPGLKTLVSQIYPDEAHFIYELLQNAEDACATQVEFSIDKTELVFAHNGTKQFNAADIEAITNIAHYTKTDNYVHAGKLMLLCDELMEKVFPDNQIVYAVYTNTDNLHIHFIANTVGLDGRKIHMDKNFMKDVFEVTLNKLALKYGFTPNEAWMRAKQPDTVSFKERKIMHRKAIDLAIEEADDFEEFLKELRDTGMIVNVGKHLSLRMDGMVKAVRTEQLGEQYSIEKIRERIATKREPFIKISIEACDEH